VFGYYLGLALRSLRRNAVLTTLMVAAIGVGIGASMTAITVFRAISGDPIPAKSGQLFTPQIQSRGPNNPDAQSEDGLQTAVSYIDANAWMRAHVAARQSAMYATWLSVRPADPKQKPFKTVVRAAYRDFFAMFAVPFHYGGPWSQADDDNRSPVVVLTRSINDQLFGGADSVGKTVRLDNETYTVVGVLQDWLPLPRFYDLQTTPFGESDRLLIPFTRAIDREMQIDGSTSCSGDSGAAFADLLKSNCLWLQFWVELPTPSAVAKYRLYLQNYAAEQQRSGRFAWPPRTALRNVREWLAYQHVVPNDVSIMVLLSFGFLAVCLLNAAGLLLAKLMSRAGEIGVRRALGASRSAIFVQCLIETAMIGLAGGVLGLSLTGLGLLAARSLLAADYVALTHLDAADVAIAIALALIATVLAGLYPTFKAAHVQPGWQLKAP
jgi:putative ABC transport system permease protein